VKFKNERMKKMKKDIRKTKLAPGEIIPLNVDFVFTGIFNDENNIDILESFLAAYFDKDIDYFKDKVKIKGRNQTINSKKNKNSQIDLLVEFEGEILYPDPICDDDILIEILIDMVNDAL